MLLVDYCGFLLASGTSSWFIVCDCGVYVIILSIFDVERFENCVIFCTDLYLIFIIGPLSLVFHHHSLVFDFIL